MKIHGMDRHESIPQQLPVIPTVDVVVFPHMIVPLLVVDERIIQGIQGAVDQGNKTVLLLAAKKNTSPEGTISVEDMYTVGTVASVMRLIKIPEGGVKILVQGVCKARVLKIQNENLYLQADVEPLPMAIGESPTTVAALVKNIKSLAEQIARDGQSTSPDFHLILSKMHEPEKISEFILSHLTLSSEESQQLLEQTTYESLLELLHNYLAREAEVSAAQERIKTRARDSMNNAQREFYLREQLRAIRQELGDEDMDDLAKLRDQLGKLCLPEDSKQEIARTISRLEKTSPDSMEAAVLRNYLEFVLALPWNISTTDNLDLSHAQDVLDRDHYGLKEVKERILDFISVRALNTSGHTPILCLVGPPGTGKTSLGQSVARALGRTFFRVSLGGAKDEAEIRGHRRTYVGAMPGRFLQGFKKAGSMNPVIVIDELDKIGNDFRGDPAAALLEVLDPAQNKTFYDNYMGIPFDLSGALFIATANEISGISEPLRDRMEVIQLSGYSLEEKVHIAQRHLIKRSREECGLADEQCVLSDELLGCIVNNYTRESGVRELERTIKKLCSKVARSLVENNELVAFTHENLEKYLGPYKFIDDECNHVDKIGISNGLAWTSHGGEMIRIEAVVMPGTGKLILTGRLGDVMKESAQAALSYARSHAANFGIDPKLFVDYDLHVHIPAGGVPKDGPSAGITILSAILSALTHRAIDAHYAMTGEIDLQGGIMPIGGVKEKILAAKRNKILHVLLPSANKRDITGIEDLISGITITWVTHAEEVLKHVLRSA
jgi:ATP-dependent Lon protease